MREKYLKEISDMLGEFLKSHGGLNNGYETYISGEVRLNCISSLDWNTPNCSDYTLKEIKRIGSLIYDKILKYLKSNNIEETLIIEKKHIEHGCFKTFTFFAPEKKIINIPYK